MSEHWKPLSETIQADQIAAYDRMREKCPVAHSRDLGWSIFRHADVLEVVRDYERFSNAAGRHLSVPNGMDPPQHVHFRRLVEHHLGSDAVHAFEPECRATAVKLIRRLPLEGYFEVMEDLAREFALRNQSGFLGWPESLHEPLRDWLRANHQAQRSGDRQALAEVAVRFDGYIRSLLAERRELGADAPEDVTTALLREEVHGRPLEEKEIVSIMRNWTVGELGTISASVGILLDYLARHHALQEELRETPERIPVAVDEILRIHPPLIANRRRTRCPVKIGDSQLPEDEKVTVIWAAANRDPRVFGNPDAYAPERNAPHNLLFGAGIHACPGSELARMELTVLLETMLSELGPIEPVSGEAPVHAHYPAGGFDRVPLRLADR